MIRNYIKLAWRNLLKNRTFSLINILGLSFSIAFCLLLFVYIRHEQSYDAFHTKKDRLYRLEMTNIWKGQDDEKPKQSLFSFLTKNDDIRKSLVFPVIVSGDMQNTFPEVKSITRMQGPWDELIRVDNQVIKEKMSRADDNFFTNFSFRLIKGNPRTVLSSLNSVVLSESAARKFFGNEDPIGKTLSTASDSSRLFTVTGIAADAPNNSSITYGVIFPMLSDPNYAENIKERLNHSNCVYIIELGKDVSTQQFEAKMNRWAKSYFADYLKDAKDAGEYRSFLSLRPLADCHYNVSFPWGHYTDMKNIYQLSCLVAIILLIASLNYVLLAISNAAARSQEVGLRKVLGSNRMLIILQFWVETQILVILAAFVGLVLAHAFLPLFNQAIGSELGAAALFSGEMILAVLALCLILGILAGYYPAWLFSKSKPVSVLKSFGTFKINPRFSKVLVVLQYTACVVLMIAAFVVNRQMQYISNKDLGFDKEQVLIVDNPVFDFDFRKKLKDRLYAFAGAEPAILQYSAMNGGLDGAGNHNRFILNGQPQWLMQVSVDYNYFELLGLKFVLGRSFSPQFSSDTISTVRASVVNETLFRMLGKQAKLGVYNEAIRSTIVGVVKDYHFASLTEKIEPEQHMLQPKYVFRFLFKVRAGKMQQVIARMEKEWKNITGNYPFEYTFLDESLAKMYEPEMRWQKTVQASCFFAILIACMGLFGLSAINAANRTKEIGIRKVLGASVKDIVASLSKGFLLLVALAILIAMPLGWWLMNKWLQDFAYRINLGWGLFAAAAVTALLIALLTVSIQAFKAASANPVKSLRTE